MAESLEYVRELCGQPADGVRWACVLEATAPKAGNVYPGRPFGDLCYADFVRAAEISAEFLCDRAQSPAQRILNSVRQVRLQIGTNVNLGILLLLGPLVAADETGKVSSTTDWQDVISECLQFDAEDSRSIFQAIIESSPGGLGTVDQMDVRDDNGHKDILAAMKMAADRDRIALQYATAFDDLIQRVLPVLYRSIQSGGDLLTSISIAHVQLLATDADSLIARKCGDAIAHDVQQRAAQVDPGDLHSRMRFDESLRDEKHKLNPGTTADLIAAALYVLLRTPSIKTH